MNSQLVNHILIGAGRSGTTTLVSYLQQHPQIEWSTTKEVPYFSIPKHYLKGEKFLHSFFDWPSNQLIHATSDTYLLSDETAPERIKHYNPNCKLSVILREPCERTYSAYQYAINKNYIEKSVSFSDVLEQEKSLLQTNTDIVDKTNLAPFYGSLYAKHLTHWLQYFPREQLFICTTYQLKNNPEQLLKQYCNFLGIHEFEFELVPAQNKSSTYRHKALHNLLYNRNHPIRQLVRVPLQNRWLRSMLTKSGLIEQLKQANEQSVSYAPMNEKERELCATYFKEDKQQLAKQFQITFPES